ncbi:MAG: hypothetical protein MJY62_03250 [Bacteroidales bacterium]|nr:hypothetical protein [Bacteroidales bacterium]
MSGQTFDEYTDFVMGKFSSLESVSFKRMFGGCVIHMAGRVLGFIFDGTFLFEPGPTIDRLLPLAERRELFPGSKLFVVIDDSMSAHRLCALARECYPDMPISKPRKKKKEAAKSEKARQKEIEKEFPFAKHFRD